MNMGGGRPKRGMPGAIVVDSPAIVAVEHEEIILSRYYESQVPRVL